MKLPRFKRGREQDYPIGKEHEITDEICRNLESTFQESKAYDKAIVRALDHRLTHPITRMPIIGGLARKLLTGARGIKPLSALESELRTSINGSLDSFVRLGRTAAQEVERYGQIQEIYQMAEEEGWSTAQFMGFIESNTDLDFTREVEGEEYDLKDFFGQVDEGLSPEQIEQRRKENLKWFAGHLESKREYLQAMSALCQISTDVLRGMVRNYFDLCEFRGGMEEIELTLKRYGGGTIAATAARETIRTHGTIYVNGMRALVHGYRKLEKLNGQENPEFGNAVAQLRADLDKASKGEDLPEIGQGSKSSKSRFILPKRE